MNYEKGTIVFPSHCNLGHSVTSVNNQHGELPNVDKLPGNTDMAFRWNHTFHSDLIFSTNNTYI